MAEVCADCRLLNEELEAAVLAEIAAIVVFSASIVIKGLVVVAGTIWLSVICCSIEEQSPDSAALTLSVA